MKDNLFWDKVKIGKENECWQWLGALNNHGYGVVKRRKIGRGIHYAHRYSFYLKHKVFPKEFCCHKCDNPKCVNPNHLFDGTPKDNMVDAANKNRLGSIQTGTKNNNSKLTQSDLIKVRQLIKEGINNTEIGKLFNVSHSTISCIRRNKTHQDSLTEKR